MRNSYQRNNHEKSTNHSWDVFEEPDEISSELFTNKQNKWVKIEKTTKILVYIFTFLVVLGGCTISKATILFISAQLNPIPKPYCVNETLADSKHHSITSHEDKATWIWVIVFIYLVPQLAMFLRSLRKLLFKTWNKPTILEFTTVFVFESLSTVGNAILVFHVLPNIDSVKGSIVMICFCIVPTILSLYSSVEFTFTKWKKRRIPKIAIFYVLSIIIQCTALGIFTFLNDGPIIWSLPISAILISFGWWQNYMKKRIHERENDVVQSQRHFTYFITSLWKCCLFIGMTILIEYLKYDKVTHLFEKFDFALSEQENIDKEENHATINQHLTPIWMMVINIAATYFAYIFGKFACKINIQRTSFAIPLHLSSLLVTTGMIVMSTAFMENCITDDKLPTTLFFNLPIKYNMTDIVFFIMGLLLLLSYALQVIHLWESRNVTFSSTEDLFLRPFYESFIIDQDLGMNRRRVPTYNLDEKEGEYKINSDSIPKLYVCGTMWHETKDEMLTFLKSVIILDQDHCCKRIARNHFRTHDGIFYDLESHIIFDDALNKRAQNELNPQINNFVKDLIASVTDAVSMIYKKNIKLKPLIKYDTPYGGRLEWILPGGTKLIAHLKDNAKIRPKKRWSQVMYLYYILGHKIMERHDIDEIQKQMIAENTYLLAIDGDMHFRPNAIQLLLQDMKENKNLAATCGRVHPVGNGIFAWYQKFEYAISHWIFKAVEDVTGCVLCCPGCFTIFRGSALMSILKTMTTQSTDAAHFIICDQGEDRWISTLLVLNGYKVGYCASADAYTNCPEGIKELFNQRRRWIPSAVAGILHFISNSKTARNVNDNVSGVYVIYQLIFHVLTALGPSLVLWMLIHICSFLFGISTWLSLVLNAIPVLIFIIVCIYATNENIQIQLAMILCGIYTPIMCCFFVGSLFEMVTHGIFVPQAILFCLFFIHAIAVCLLHPKEIYYLKYLLIFYTLVPLMSMIKVIYSAFNMHKFSWGTREVNEFYSTNLILNKSLWTEHEVLQRGKIEKLSDDENIFWTCFLKKYLYPVVNKEQKSKFENDLKLLRDKAASTMVVINLIFLSALFLLTMKNVTISWPWIISENLQLELFNTILILFLCLLMLAQVVAILFHRFSTFSQIMRNTILKTKKNTARKDPLEIMLKVFHNQEEERKAKYGRRQGQLCNTTKVSNNLNDSTDLETIFLSYINKDSTGFHEGDYKTMDLVHNTYTCTNEGFTEDV